MHLANRPSQVAAPPGAHARIGAVARSSRGRTAQGVQSGIGRVTVVPNVRGGWTRAQSAGPDHGRDGPARWGVMNVVTKKF